MKKKWAERLFSLILMAIGVIGFWETIGLPHEAGRTGLFTGPAFYPRWICILLIMCSVIPFARTIIKPADDQDSMAFPPPVVIVKICGFLMLIVFTLLIIPYTGWLGAQLALVFLVEMIFEKRGWLKSLIIAIGAMVVIYCIFELGLGIRLPRGMFE